MMKMLAVFDAKANTFGVPFFSVNTPMAVRQFTAVANDGSHDISRFAEDFTLFELGDYDEVSGKVEMLPSPKSVVIAIMLKKDTNGAA